MRLSVLKAHLLKEFKDLFRSRIFVMIYLMPSLIMILFGNGIKMEVSHSRTVILDYDNTPLAEKLVLKFEHSKYFDTELLNISEKSALGLIKKGKADLIVIIPESFEKNLIKGVKSEIGVFIDGAFPTRANTLEAYARGIILDAAMEAAPETAGSLIVVNNRNLFNQAMRDQDMIIPGIIGLVLLVAPAILSALLIVKEKEEGSIFNFYASPIKKSEFLAAKLLPVILLHSVNIFILFLWATYLFDLPFRGSFLLYWLTSEIYILISLSIGLLVSIIAPTQIVAIVLTVVITIIPGFLYSGMLMPISSMESESYIEAHLYPVMYYNHIIYDTFLIGQGFGSPKILLYLAILLLYALTLFSLGHHFLKKEIK
jgi:ABC-2 type transport system permease protein